MSGAVRESHQVGAVRVDHTPERRFYEVGGAHLQKMGVITEIFNRILVPLYGSQEKALRQIRESTDRRAYLLYEGKHPVGVLVFKTVLSDEFAEYKVRDSVEIKSLFVDNSQHNSGRGLGSALVNKVKQEVRKLGLGHTGIHVTVSETKEDSLMFFRKKGFEVVHQWYERYQPGTTEYLLRWKETVEVLDAEAAPAVPLQARKKRHPAFIHMVASAHLDDIHTLTKFADGTFVSGSKDNCLYRWDKAGTRVQVISEVEPANSSDRNWITAVESINDAYWLSAQRNGKVSLWRADGSYVKDIRLQLPGRRHVSRAYNRTRVNCLARGVDALRPSFFVGVPTMFDEYNLIEGKTVSATVVHKNDWVYAIEPLTPNRLLTVTACTVNLWTKTNQEWALSARVLGEPRRVQVPSPGKGKKNNFKWQRPFISSLVPLTDTKDTFAITRFGGAVEVLDLNASTVVKTWREHALGRVWAAEKIAKDVFASCAEDGLIKVWDVRASASVATIESGKHQVNTLLQLDPHTLVVGTSADAVVKVRKTAQLQFYDIRRLAS